MTAQLELFHVETTRDPDELLTRVARLEAQLRGMQIYCEDLERQITRLMMEKRATR